MMKSFYLTGYKYQNLGDDLFFLMVLNRYTDSLFLFEDISSGYYSNLFYGFQNISVLPCIHENLAIRFLNKIRGVINRYWDGQFFSAYQRSNIIKVDAYLKIGGSIFIEPSQGLDTIKNRFIAEKKYFGDIPFFFVSSNFGPYTSSLFFNNSEYVIKKSNGICFRDTYSYGLFKQFEHVRVAPDVLFGIKQYFSSSEKKAKSLGISLINLSDRSSLASYYKNYLESISSFIYSQMNNYEVIRLFSFCEPEGDGQAIEDLIALLPDECKNRLEIVIYNGNYKDFLLKLSEVETLLATRFHAMILGFVYGIRTIPIIYSKKMSHVLNDIKSDVFTISIDNISKENLMEAVSRSKVICVDEQINDSQKQFSDLDRFLES